MPALSAQDAATAISDKLVPIDLRYSAEARHHINFAHKVCAVLMLDSSYENMSAVLKALGDQSITDADYAAYPKMVYDKDGQPKAIVASAEEEAALNPPKPAEPAPGDD